MSIKSSVGIKYMINIVCVNLRYVYQVISD